MTEEPSVLERAARTICARHAMYDADMIVVGRDNEPVPYWTEFADDARAVLQAIRTPSKEVLQAGATAHEWYAESYDQEGLCGKIYEAMIDKALTE